MEKKKRERERKEIAKERKRKWSVVVAIVESEASIQGSGEDETFMNGSMNSEVLESIVSLKWFIEQKIICSMLLHKGFSSSSLWRRGLAGIYRHHSTQQPCSARRAQQERLSGEVREPPQLHWGSWNWESPCSTLTASLPPSLPPSWSCCSVPYFKAASCWEWWNKSEKGASACFLELICVELREQIWDFGGQGSFSPAFGWCNQKERMREPCLDSEGSDPDHCTHLISLDELNQTGQMSDLPLL